MMPKKTDRKPDILTLEAQQLAAGFAAYSAALDPYNRVMTEMNYKWGPGKLEKLVAPELAAKLDRQYLLLDDAVKANDWHLAAKQVDALVRGYAALETAAVAGGAVPPNPVTMRFERNDGVYLVCRTIAESWNVPKEDGVAVISVEELLNQDQAVRKKVFDDKK